MDPGRLHNIQLFPAVQNDTIQSRRRPLSVTQDHDFSRERFGRRRFKEGIARTATTEKEGGFTCGLEIAISGWTHITDN
jgi:hypothetical protein